MTTHVYSVGGDRMFSGPIEESLAFLRTHALADRVERDDGVRLATCAPWSQAVLWSMDTPAGRAQGS